KGVAFIRIFGGYCLKKSRPYMVMKDGIEIPEKYTPSGEREKVKYKDITKIQYEESQTYGKVLVIKTVSGGYIIRRNMGKKVMKALPSSATDKFQKKREVEEYPDYAEENEYHDYDEIKDSLPKLARKVAERNDKYKDPSTAIRIFWKFILMIVIPLGIMVYFDPILLGWILISGFIIFTAIHLILIEYPLYKYYKSGPDEDYRGHR
ncbi:MAG: hypothetical protein KGY68_07690, partial [Candidatus Thermoplasmatota archaeon]|nr:hypothetical protein [Candidatus Thermoplasmatota archaeon]